MSIETVLEGFVLSEEPGAIVLKGSWGVGKTHFWRHRIVDRIFSRLGKKKYSYVSLFGINSLVELKTVLAFATDEFDRDALNQRRRGSRYVGWFWKSLKWGGDGLQYVPKVGAQLGKAYERIGFLLIRGRIICLDDIERRGKGLDLKDILGLVSFLVEQRGCRVVAIVNSGQFDEGDQKVWDTHREKVFDGEVTYCPTTEQTIALGLQVDQDAPWHDAVFSSLHQLGVSNIRLVKRTARSMRLVWEALGPRPLSQDTIERVAKVVPLLVWSAHGAGEGAPPWKYVIGPSALDLFGIDNSGPDNETADEKRWRALVLEYSCYLNGPLDDALVRLIETGVPETEALVQGVAAYERDAELRRKTEAWHGAWRLYHDSVEDNADEIVEAFARHWPEVMAREHAANLDSAVRMMRLLGRGDLATEFIRQWVDARKGERTIELSRRELHVMRRIEDKEILAAIEDALRQAEERPLDLEDAFQSAFDRDYPSQETIRAFSKTTVPEIVALLQHSGREDFMRVVKRLADFRGHPEGPEKRAGENMWAACTEIAKGSPLNADRMKSWLGIDLAVDGQTQD